RTGRRAAPRLTKRRGVTMRSQRLRSQTLLPLRPTRVYGVGEADHVVGRHFLNWVARLYPTLDRLEGALDRRGPGSPPVPESGRHCRAVRSLTGEQAA